MSKAVLCEFHIPETGLFQITALINSTISAQTQRVVPQLPAQLEQLEWAAQDDANDAMDLEG